MRKRVADGYPLQQQQQKTNDAETYSSSVQHERPSEQSTLLGRGRLRSCVCRCVIVTKITTFLLVFVFGVKYHRNYYDYDSNIGATMVRSDVLSSNGSGDLREYPLKECEIYNSVYFSKLLDQIKQDSSNNGNNGSSAALCTTDVIGQKGHCRCHNPFVPVSHQDRVEHWDNIRQMNLELIKNSQEPDVVLYGDSITERLLGRFFGKYGPKMQDYTTMTQRVLSKQGGGKVNALLLGISSDEIAHLLYRMQNGELTSTLNPRVFWVLIGTNDLTAGCSSNVIVAGIILTVQAIRKQHATTPIVVNSILPRGANELLTKSRQWKLLQEINQQLECYSGITPNVIFANTTSLFTETRTGNNNNNHGGGMFIRKDYFEKDNLHPSVEGSRAWGEFIGSKVLSLMA